MVKVSGLTLRIPKFTAVLVAFPFPAENQNWYNDTYEHLKSHLTVWLHTSENVFDTTADIRFENGVPHFKTLFNCGNNIKNDDNDDNNNGNDNDNNDNSDNNNNDNNDNTNDDYC